MGNNIEEIDIATLNKRWDTQALLNMKKIFTMKKIGKVFDNKMLWEFKNKDGKGRIIHVLQSLKYAKLDYINIYSATCLSRWDNSVNQVSINNYHNLESTANAIYSCFISEYGASGNLFFWERENLKYVTGEITIDDVIMTYEFKPNFEVRITFPENDNELMGVSTGKAGFSDTGLSWRVLRPR